MEVMLFTNHDSCVSSIFLVCTVGISAVIWSMISFHSELVPSIKLGWLLFSAVNLVLVIVAKLFWDKACNVVTCSSALELLAINAAKSTPCEVTNMVATSFNNIETRLRIAADVSVSIQSSEFSLTSFKICTIFSSRTFLTWMILSIR